MQARVTRSRRAGGWRPARSLSGRLIAGLVALLALGCATVGVVTYLAIQRALLNELDNQLQAATSVANTCLDHWLDPDGNGGDNNTGEPAPGTSASPLMTPYCEGLGTGTLLAYLHQGQWGGYVVPDPDRITLSAADKATLGAITPSQMPRPGGPPAPTYTRNLTSADSGGEAYSITVAADPSGATYVTGLSLSGTHDLLKDVALAEIGVFGGVLVLAGVLGTALGPAVAAAAAPGRRHRVPGGRAAARIRRGRDAQGRP